MSTLLRSSLEILQTQPPSGLAALLRHALSGHWWGLPAMEGDPLDVLVVTPYPVAPGSVIRARPVGVLHMSDEAGGDAKLVAVPHDKLTVLYKDVQEYTDLPALLIEQIKHFFENYKDLEKGKWVKVEGWGGAEEARDLINKAVAAYQK